MVVLPQTILVLLNKDILVVLVLVTQLLLDNVMAVAAVVPALLVIQENQVHQNQPEVWVV